MAKQGQLYLIGRRKRKSGGGSDAQFLWAMLLLPTAMFVAVWNSDLLAGSFTDGNSPTISSGADSETGSFGFCHEGGGFNCVVDGDTLYYRGTKIRIADIDTPETHEPRCAAEAKLGATATRRLQTLLNAGPFRLEDIDRDADKYGRKLRVVTRDGESLGETLVSENLARWYKGGRRPWC
jgi:micrococcal nuclease